MVTYTIPCVHQGEFAEARIAFPSHGSQLAASGEERMSTILSERRNGPTKLTPAALTLA